jgi:hypothetical protein
MDWIFNGPMVEVRKESLEKEEYLHELERERERYDYIYIELALPMLLLSNLQLLSCSRMYILVKFMDNNSVAVIPSNWLHSNQCPLWPPYKTSDRLDRAVRKREPPGESWQAYPIVEMYRHGKLFPVFYISVSLDAFDVL